VLDRGSLGGFQFTDDEILFRTSQSPFTSQGLLLHLDKLVKKAGQNDYVDCGIRMAQCRVQNLLQLTSTYLRGTDCMLQTTTTKRTLEETEVVNYEE
jgi:hypothetical protein